MAYTNDPVNNPLDRIRLNVGDTYECAFMEDEVYQYLYDKYNGNERQASIEAARFLLGSFAKYTRERAGDIEVFGAEFFRNYKEFLLELLRNPNFNVFNPVPYAGGISVSDMELNTSDSDTVERPLKIGMSESVQY